MPDVVEAEARATWSPGRSRDCGRYDSPGCGKKRRGHGQLPPVAGEDASG
jgi:hypothetical protein